MKTRTYTEDFLFGGIKTLKDEDGVIYVHARDFPILIKRLHLAELNVEGIDVFKMKMGELHYITTYARYSRDKYWYVRAYPVMIKECPGCWFSPTYVTDEELERLTYDF